MQSGPNENSHVDALDKVTSVVSQRIIIWKVRRTFNKLFNLSKLYPQIAKTSVLASFKHTGNVNREGSWHTSFMVVMYATYRMCNLSETMILLHLCTYLGLPITHACTFDNNALCANSFKDIRFLKKENSILTCHVRDVYF